MICHWTPIWMPVIASNLFVIASLIDIAQERLATYIVAQAQQQPRLPVTDMAQRVYTTLSEIFTIEAHQARALELVHTAVSAISEALFYKEVQPERTLADVIKSATRWPTKSEFEGEFYIPVDTEGDLAFICYCMACLSVVLVCVYLFMYVCSLCKNTRVPVINNVYKPTDWGQLNSDIVAAAARGLPASFARCIR